MHIIMQIDSRGIYDKYVEVNNMKSIIKNKTESESNDSPIHTRSCSHNNKQEYHAKKKHAKNVLNIYDKRSCARILLVLLF